MVPRLVGLVAAWAFLLGQMAARDLKVTLVRTLTVPSHMMAVTIIATYLPGLGLELVAACMALVANALLGEYSLAPIHAKSL